MKPLTRVAVPASPKERDAAEADALERLYAALPTAQRASVREALESPDWNTQHSIVGIPGNPVAADLLTTVYAIREARRAEAATQLQRELATRMAAPVTLALLPASRGLDYAASVIRTAGGRGENVIVFAPGEVSPERVAHALRYLAYSRVTHGEYLQKDVRINIRGRVPPLSAEERELANGIVEQLRTAQPRPVHGFGRIRGIRMEVAPVKTPPSIG